MWWAQQGHFISSISYIWYDVSLTSLAVGASRHYRCNLFIVKCWMLEEAVIFYFRGQEHLVSRLSTTSVAWSPLFQNGQKDGCHLFRTKTCDKPTCSQYRIYSHIETTPETRQNQTQQDGSWHPAKCTSFQSLGYQRKKHKTDLMTGLFR